MTAKRRTFTEMVTDGLAYLAENTQITYFGDGSVARSLVESMALEVARLQDFVAVHYDNRFLSTASGVFLDLFGEMLGLPRLQQSRATVEREDQSIRFYVRSGTLGAKLPDPNDPVKGLIPSGTSIANEAGTIEFTVTDNITFPKTAKTVYVPALAIQAGRGYNVGPNQLVKHSLGNSEVLVTNDAPITTGTELEPDDEYRYRLSRAMTTRFGANEVAVQVAAQTARGISKASILEFARGAGTYDVLLVPRGNKLAKTSRDETQRLLNEVTAFGISSRVREPNYIPFKVSIQLRFQESVDQARRAALRDRAQQAVLNYFASIPLGGEFIVNQLRTAVLSVSRDIEDLRVAELRFSCRPRTIRNFRLRQDELFVPDDQAPDPVEVI